MSSDDVGWGWFAPPAGRSEAASPDPGRSDLERDFARCFGTPEGRRVLAHLRAATLDRALGPAASVDTLRHLEGQRHLVAHMTALAARGRGV